MPGKEAKKSVKVYGSMMLDGVERKYRIRNNVHFHRPKTLQHARSPLYERSPLKPTNWKEATRVLRYPVKTDANMTLIDKANTIVFIVDLRADKKLIKESFASVFGVPVASVNTLITPKGLKKAFIKLPADVSAVDVAAKIGLA